MWRQFASAVDPVIVPKQPEEPPDEKAPNGRSHRLPTLLRRSS
jgi:hypothetical protein